MKRSLVIIAFIIALINFGICEEKNLILNGGFEILGNGLGDLVTKEPEMYDKVENSPFLNWGFGGKWEGGEYKCEVVPGRTGKNAVKISCVTKGRGGICTPLISVEGGSKLLLTFWIKADNAMGRIFVNFEGDPGDGWKSIDCKPGTYDWMEMKREIIVPYGKGGKNPRINLFFYNKTAGDVYIDDVSLTKIAKTEEEE